jgi:hypothetical protein
MLIGMGATPIDPLESTASDGFESGQYPTSWSEMKNYSDEVCLWSIFPKSGQQVVTLFYFRISTHMHSHLQCNCAKVLLLDYVGGCPFRNFVMIIL